MKKVIKKQLILKIILVMLMILMFYVFSIKKIFASENTNTVKVYFVYNKVSIKAKDTLVININFSNYNNVKEIKLRIGKQTNIEPIISSDGYFDINDNTNFSNILVNEYVQNDSLNLHLIKENIEVTNYQNNICSISFLITNDVENIIKLFEDNIKIYLFDSKMQLLEYEIKHTEKLNATWEIDNNILEVYSSVPNFSECFKVNNRDKNEYEIIVKQNIDPSVIGLQAISIIVIDKLNFDYLIYNQAINIVDSSAPVLNYPEKIEIKDIEINNLTIEKYIQISDNYDLLPVLHVTYLDKEKNVISNVDEFKKYIRGEKKAFIEVFASDASSNSTDKKEIEFSIDDITAPNIVLKNSDNNLDVDINNINIIYVDDTKIDEFDINNYFMINDNYDPSPNIIFSFYNNMTCEVVDNVLEELKKGNVVSCEYYGIDNANNKSATGKTLIMVKDITPPIISGVQDLIVNDVDLDDYDFVRNINYIDNIDLEPSLIIKYYVDDEEYQKYEFLDKIKKGYIGSVKYVAIDKALNYSLEYLQKITVVDTTPPVITIDDIKDDGKYLQLNEIKYKVEDNFENEVKVYVTLNNYEYKNTKITDVGSYEFKVTAIDLAGNETVRILKFNIIEKNITGCGDDVSCYVDNYASVIVVVTILMLVSVGTMVFKIVYKVVKNKKNKNELNITMDNHS